jgi:hypothetical protein
MGGRVQACRRRYRGPRSCVPCVQHATCDHNGRNTWIRTRREPSPPFRTGRIQHDGSAGTRDWT